MLENIRAKVTSIEQLAALREQHRDQTIVFCGGTFIFYCEDPLELCQAIKKRFVDCFEIDFAFEYQDIKALNML